MPRMTTIVRPPLKQYESDHQFSIRDYISVPAISLLGTYEIYDLLPIEQVIQLQAFANRLEKVASRRIQFIRG